MSAVPAGYELKVKREGQYVTEPPAAPKGWQYVKEVLCKNNGRQLSHSCGLKYSGQKLCLRIC